MRTTNLGFVVTTDCNLRCVHCYARAGDVPRNMSESTARAILRRNVGAGDVAVYLSFFGGEPTLNMEAVTAVVDEAEALSFPASFHISTNGVMTESAITYIISKRMDVSVSLDGLGETNARLRPAMDASNSSRAVERTIRRLVKDSILVQVRVTVSQANIREISRLIDYCADFGVRYVHIEPLSLDGRAVDNALELPSPSDYARSFSSALDRANERGVWVISSPLMNLISPCDYFCTSAHGDKLLFDPDGSVSACYKVQSGGNGQGRFIIGDYDTTSGEFRRDMTKTSSLASITVEQMSGCSDCFAKYLCGGGCPHRNWTSTGSAATPDPWSCATRKLIIREAILRLAADSQRGRTSPVLGGIAYEQAVAGRLAERSSTWK